MKDELRQILRRHKRGLTDELVRRLTGRWTSLYPELTAERLPGLGPADIHAVLFTHLHPDHTRRPPGTPVYRSFLLSPCRGRALLRRDRGAVAGVSVDPVAT
jgi:hypothetical protein